MSTPTPAPRTLLNESKKPIPAPRTMIPTRPEQKDGENDGKNTFSRRVRTLSNASKQLAGDIGEKLNETRQSVRKIAKRFTNNFAEPQSEIRQTENDNTVDLNIFNSIRFNSPINQQNTEAIYNNVDSVDGDFDEPPPPYPPPPLREEMYDKPQSLASGSTNSSSDGVFRRNHTDYESVFPPYPYNSDSESCIDMTAGVIDRNIDYSRSESWNFYEGLPTTTEEHTYNNIDSTPTIKAEVNRVNSIYENHEILEFPKRPTQSILMEFDPLASNETPQLSEAEELSELEKTLQGDLYGNIPMDNLSIFDDNESDDIYISPPSPPTRIDSLPDHDTLPNETPAMSNNDKPATSTTDTLSPNNNNINSSKTNWFIGSQETTKPNDSKPYKWFKQMNDVLKKAPELVKNIRGKDNILQRPMIKSRGVIQQKGMLYKITNGPVEDLFGEFSARWCVLQNGVLLCCSDNTCDNIKEQIPIDTILSIQLLQDQKFKYRCDEDELHCIEINIAGKVRGGHVYGSKNISERRVWMQNIAECLTSSFGAKITSDYKRIGWGYIKEGLSGQWTGAWLVLSKRKLYYAFDNSAVKSLDLRKARYFKLEPIQEHDNTPTTTDKGPNLVIHFTSGTFYFRMWTQRETKIWCHMIKISARNNGGKLEQQQLTKNDIPVVVEKCINFVYAYGSMAEGIYRRAGSNSVVAELLSQFRMDAWSVQLTEKYSNHDVATALKRFFRDLAEPLIDSNKRQYLYQVSLVKNQDERVRMYKGIFDQVPKIIYKTTRCLLGHLHFISTQCDKNLMTVENLTAIWGPTLLQHDTEDDVNKDRQIMAQLINLYKHIFPEDAKEMEQERKMLTVLEKYTKSPQGAVNVKSSGDFRVWVYLYNKEGRTFNILVGPQKTAYDIICELSGKVNVPVHELVLEEVILNDNLVRPIHHTEKVLDVVLKWGYWDDNDRKDNCLMLNNISKYWEYLNDHVLPLSAELKFADSKSKQLKPFTFEFQQARLNYFKDKSCTITIASWNIEDILWYFGHESKRNVPSKYTLTFIKKSDLPKRTKISPYFGNVLCWSDPSLRALWIASMWRAEHPNNLTPPPQHVNLMTS